MGGGDKTLLELAGRPLLDWVIDRLKPQCECLVLNANGDTARFPDREIPIVGDSMAGHPGPLAGVLAALEWAHAQRPGFAWIVTVPGDTPFIPNDLVSRLHEARWAGGRPLVCAASGGHVHPTIGIWPVILKDNLHEALRLGQRRVRAWADNHGVSTVDWPLGAVDPFFNINTPDDLREAKRLVGLMDRPSSTERDRHDRT
jgi:molybdopterin-guanine dinucleotide biosynthesis protein A